jgi:beta-barrel assembly-enhancing protease
VHPSRTILACVSLFLATSLCHAQQPSPTPAPFAFAQVDLDLLEKSDQLDRQFQDKGLVFNDSDTVKYIAGVGQAVLPRGPEFDRVHWRFFVLRDPMPNAFALPNGSIYIHTGLLSLMDNEAQLAGVLAHEETHVMNRHSYLENRSHRKKTEAVIVLEGAASLGSLTGGIGVEVAEVADLVIPAIAASTIYGYSRELEQEADLRAVHSLVDTGYSSEEMKNMFDEMQKDHDVDLSKKSFYQDHPKLQDRSKYVGALAASLKAHTDNPMVEADRYLLETESAVRHDAELEIRAGRARTAVWSMERIVKKDTKLADNYYVLGEAYRGLGARTPEPTAQELTDEGKSQARKMKSKMTSQEYEAALLKAPGGQQAWDSNRELAEKNYKRAIEISPDEPEPHRGLGFLYELEHEPEQSVQEFRNYLELAPSAVDAPQIRRRIETMEKDAVKPSQPPAWK